MTKRATISHVIEGASAAPNEATPKITRLA